MPFNSKTKQIIRSDFMKEFICFYYNYGYH